MGKIRRKFAHILLELKWNVAAYKVINVTKNGTQLHSFTVAPIVLFYL